MDIREKLKMDVSDIATVGPVTIVAFGDSITHGAFSKGEFDYDAVYWNRLRKKINAVRPEIPVNVINAGIGGYTAKRSVDRLYDGALRYSPDLMIVCFGLNDVMRDKEEYLDSLDIIFRKCTDCGIEVIFMTPNMLNTYVSEDTDEKLLAYAQKTAEAQNSGRMDEYMEAACAVAGKYGIAVCDCYVRWKELNRSVDTTKMLANRINHPTKDMHELFAQALFDTIFVNSDTAE